MPISPILNVQLTGDNNCIGGCKLLNPTNSATLVCQYCKDSFISRGGFCVVKCKKDEAFLIENTKPQCLKCNDP